MSIEQNVNHPSHYGGKDNPYETIKVIEAWGLDNNFDLGNAIKYLSRMGKKEGNSAFQDLLKAQFYVNREVEKMRHRSSQADATARQIEDLSNRLDEIAEKYLCDDNKCKDEYYDDYDDEFDDYNSYDSDDCDNHNCNDVSCEASNCPCTISNDKDKNCAEDNNTYIEVPEDIDEAFEKIIDYFFDSADCEITLYDGSYFVISTRDSEDVTNEKRN